MNMFFCCEKIGGFSKRLKLTLHIHSIAREYKNLFRTNGQMVIDWLYTRECFIRKVLHSSAFNTHARFQSVLRDYSIVA